jgi:ribokinase
MPEGVPDVVVVGSANLDLVLPVRRIPRPGETVLAGAMTRGPGGKGANQAVASARAGARTAMVVALGDDEGGAVLRQALEGVDLSLATTSQAPTGTAIITVDDSGENSIVVAPGANGELTLSPAAVAAIGRAKVVLSQLEIPFPTVRDAAAASTYFILNAAPAAELPDELLAEVDLLVVNETEAEAIAGPDRSALMKKVPAAVVTLGAAGAVILSRELGDAGEIEVPGVTVDVVDTTAAGDTFCGVLAATLVRQLAAGSANDSITTSDLTNAVRRANVAASLSVEVAGAIPSVPHGDAIDARYAEVYL